VAENSWQKNFVTHVSEAVDQCPATAAAVLVDAISACKCRGKITILVVIIKHFGN
jgi:hypothetical protein